MVNSWKEAMFSANKIIACIEDPAVIKKILDNLNAKSGAAVSVNQLPARRVPSQA